MIVRNAEEKLAACLESALPWVDELCVVDTGSTDSSMEIVANAAERYGVPLKTAKYDDPIGDERWISNFSEARNISFDLCTKDMILWLDHDDVLYNGRLMREVVQSNCTPGVRPDGATVDAIVVRYDYHHDDEDNCTVRQPRVRLVRNGYFRWDGAPVHENLMPLRPAYKNEDPYGEGFWVIHRDHGNRVASAERNLWIAEQWRAGGHQMTSLLWKAVGDSHSLKGNLAEAADAYREALEISSHSAERYVLFVRRAEAYRGMDRFEEALDDYCRAIRACPEYKAAYLAMAEVHAELERWGHVLVFCAMADNAQGDADGLIFNPQADEVVPTLLRVRAYLGMEEYDKAMPLLSKLTSLRPGNEDVRKMHAAVGHAVRERDAYLGFMNIYDMLDEDKREKLAQLAPDFMKKFPVISGTLRPKPDGRPRLTIMCSRTTNLWGPSSLATGTGGSEESAIYLSRHMAQRGWQVEVYNSCGLDDMGTDEFGVTWLPEHGWDPELETDIFVAWRDVRLPGLARNVKGRYIWLQDVPHPEVYTKEFCDILDGVICISGFQASCLSELGQRKVVESANGIDLHRVVDGANRRNKFIYASSPDRGLLELLRSWPQIRDNIPDAELHVFYGFRDVYMKQAARSQRAYNTMFSIKELIGQDGVHSHGMVGVDELHRQFADSGFWLYPTSFSETFCITAAKAMAMGAIPITSRFDRSSLPEVCGKYDLGPELLPGDYDKTPENLQRWVDRVIEVNGQDLTDYRKEMKAWAREAWDWNKAADRWDLLFRARLASHQGLPASLETSSAR